MACPFTGGDETIEIAQIAVKQATTLDKLRQAQAVLLPLMYGLSLGQTARVLGISPGWACQLRRCSRRACCGRAQTAEHDN